MLRLHRLRLPFLYAALLCTLIGIAACDAPQNTFSAASDANVRTLSLYNLIIVLASVVGIGVLAALGYILLKFRAQPGREPQQIHGSTRLEIAWTMIPIAVLAMIAVPTIFAITAAAREPEPEALRVRAIGHQWWFEFHYIGAGPNGEDVITSNELYLPVGRQVSISMESRDVIHSFWVPRLLGKMDMIPNRVNRLEPFTPNEIGIFYGQCAEFCGLAHAQMRFRVHVVSLGQFSQHIGGLTTPPADVAPGSAAASGQGVFLLAGGCAACHAIYGTSAQGRIGPDLTLFGERVTVGAGILPATAENVRDWIANVRAMKALPDVGSMPTFHTGAPNDILTEQQVADVAAYLRSLRIP